MLNLSESSLEKQKQNDKWMNEIPGTNPSQKNPIQVLQLFGGIFLFFFYPNKN